MVWRQTSEMDWKEGAGEIRDRQIGLQMDRDHGALQKARAPTWAWSDSPELIPAVS